MAIVLVPDRHLAALVSPAQLTSLGGVGAAIEHRRPHAIRKWAFGGLGQYEDYSQFLDEVAAASGPSQNQSLDLTAIGAPGYSIFGSSSEPSFQCAPGSIQVDSSGNCFNPTNPSNGITTPSGTIWGGSSGSSSNWLSLISQAIGTAGQVARVAELPSGSSMLPNGAILSSAGSISSMLPMLLIGGGLLLVLAMSGRG